MVLSNFKGAHGVRESCTGILKRHTKTLRIENTRKGFRNAVIKKSRLL